ncbi:hypothetical protein DSM106972_043280 [Dulcicalothrix desertica PCC 7102]|uniref:Uncharacterized protein n=1 Tax=Dulcicalothrix desertica PCC 7102 TaxID=232991 RepID=A0A433VFF7_9CYAN|nr:hypothetical protein DSM106972_043280 [Dulcicalothrix desertica PCC 7102]
MTNYLQTEIYEEYISALDIEKIRRYVNHTISVKGKIKGVYVDKDNFIIYFYFTENALNGFYAYVLRNSYNKFINPTSYLEINVVVSGIVSLNNKNQPRININKDSQLRSID